MSATTTKAQFAPKVGDPDTGYVGKDDVDLAIDGIYADLVNSDTVDNIVKLTQAQYDALGTPVSTTLYVIVG